MHVGGTQTPVGPGALGDVATLVFRSRFPTRSHRTLAVHTAFNFGRTTLAAIQEQVALFDYDLHLGLHLADGTGAEWVIAVGGGIGYTFDSSPYARFTGDLRLGREVPLGKKSAVGAYLRPFVGYQSAPQGHSAVRGVTAGAFVEVAWLFNL